METISATLIHGAEDGLTVVVPGGGQVTVADPRLADFECRQLLQRHRLAAVAALVAQLRDDSGIEADDLGFERLWELAGSLEERERMVAQLLLMATLRARLVGLPTDDLVAFVRTTMG